MSTSIETQIDQALTRYSVSDQSIKELSEMFLPLRISSPEDAEGIEAVVSALATVKRSRIAVERTRKALKADALKYGRAVDAEAKRIKGLIEPIESHLKGQQDAVAAEIARREAEARAKRVALLDERVSRLAEFGASLPTEDLAEMEEPQFQLALQKAKQAQVERAEAEEAERISLEAERQKLADEREEARKEREKLRQERAELRKEAAEKAPPVEVAPTAEPEPVVAVEPAPDPGPVAAVEPIAFLVITEVPDPEGPDARGNLALRIPTHIQMGGELPEPVGNTAGMLVPTHLLMAMRGPVFQLGDILITDGEREIAGARRKPSKWGVGYEAFTDVREAIARSREVER